MTLDELVRLLEGLRSTPSREAGGFSELDHGLQCAFELEQARPDDYELQVAGLVHDIGHQLGPDEHHARLGAEQVRPVLGDRVAELVGAHVDAKRYLVAVEPSYRSLLSADSSATLVAQGGALSAAEAEGFRRSRVFADALELRRADEAAKVPGRLVPSLGHWISKLEKTS